MVRLGVMVSWGRSTCCSTLRSAMPSTSLISLRISLPRAKRRLRSGPKILMAMLALVPESMASMRWLMGDPTSMFTPGMACSFSLMSATTSSFERPSRAKGASISEVLTPRACSSSSARPVLRPTTSISGMVISALSAMVPMRSDSSIDTPGRVLTLMVNEPSLKDGKKLLPMPAKITMARTRAAAVPKMTGRWWASAPFSRNR